LPVPPGWERLPAKASTFGEYLQRLLFEPTDSTFFWDGTIGIYHPVAAIHRLKNLTENQQCADVIMRLNSDYKRSIGVEIHWHDVNGKLKIWKGDNYDRFMNGIYNYSNTYSLYKFDSYKVKLADMLPGDILILPGFPGHVVMVTDVLKKGDKIKIAIVEGFTPAVQPFLYKSGEDIHLEWNKGVTVSGYHFDEDNLRRLK
jgi:hypothetical protein